MPRFSVSRSVDSYSYYHVVLRGNRREALADTAKDRRALNQIAIDTMRRFDIKLHAYCLMPHQLRVLVQLDDRFLVEVLRRVAKRYSRHRNQTLKTAGELFERPYTAQRVGSNLAFLTLLRSIHLNPVITNEVIVPSDYPWSSHRSYLGYRSNALITTDYGLSLFSPDSAHARVAYLRFMTEGISSDVRDAESPDKIQAIGNDALSPALSSNAADATTLPSLDSHNALSDESKTATTRLERKRSRRLSRQFISVY